MHDELVALVTGANQGIGLQIAKEFRTPAASPSSWVRGTSRRARRPRRASKAARGPWSSTSPIRCRSPRRPSAFGRSSAGSTCSSTTPPSPTPRGRTCPSTRSSRPDDRASRRSTRCAPSSRRTSSSAPRSSGAMLPLLREAARRADRQRVERGRLAHETDRSDESESDSTRRFGERRVCPVEDRAQRDHRGVRDRARGNAHQGERGVPGLHQDEPQQVSRHEERRTRRASRAPFAPDANGPTGTFSGEDGPIPW